MLSQLHIENIAVIERADIGFSGGFHVLTGETGAGKSILIDAICAVLGERTSKELIRTGCESATVSAAFTDIPPAAISLLEELGFEDEGGTLILQRTLQSSGKSVCRINGRLATASMLRDVGNTLINIHGQHDSQALLAPERHAGYLDLLAENGALLGAYQSVYRDLSAVIRALVETRLDEAQTARRTELLEYQIKELTDARLEPGERQALIDRKARIQNAEKIAMSLGQARECLQGTDDGAGAQTLLESAAEALLAAARYLPGMVEISEKLSATAIELEEFSSDLRAVADETEYDPAELAGIEDRLDLLYRLSHKYGESEEEMLAFLANAQDELSALGSAETRAAELEAKKERLSARLLERAAALTQSRKKAAAEFERRVCGELSFLDMPGVRFTVWIGDTKPSPSGADKIEFLISANPGEPPKPLARIASGGELSRIMLAIKNVLADKDGVPTLIFDEIDAGVSGRAAQKVGLKLRQTAQGRQTICVTHLAQIAALAHHQLLIEKRVREGRTYTYVTELDLQGRAQELARIIGGAQITENTLRSAREMLEQAQAE